MKILSVAFVLSLLVPIQAFAFSRLEGKIFDLDVENSKYTIQDSRTGELHVFDFSPSTAVRIDNRKYRDIAKLTVGDSVVYKKAKKVSDKKKYITATIKGLDRENQKVTFIDAKTGDLKTYNYATGSKSKRGSRDLNVDKLRLGQKVVLEVVTR